MINILRFLLFIHKSKQSMNDSRSSLHIDTTNVLQNVLSHSLINFILLIGGMMVAVWMRQNLPYGRFVGETYQWWPLELNILLLVATVGGYAGALYTTRLVEVSSYGKQFHSLIMATALACGLIYFLLPDLSLLQLVYFSATSLLLGLFMVILPARLRESAYSKTSDRENLKELWENRYLFTVWVQYRIRTRYSQTILGVLWIVLLPLASSAVLAFAFSQLLGAGVRLGVPFVVFVLAGHVIFDIFRNTIQNAKGGITSMFGIIKQVYFPREIIILLILGETMVDFLFTFIATVLVAAAFGIYPNLNYVFLPIPILLMICLSAGLAFIVSWLSVQIRDLQQLIGVLLQLLFYSTVLYDPSRAAPEFELIMAANPLSAIVVSFRDILLYGQPPDFSSLLAPIVLSIVLLYYGYVYFKVNEDQFANL